MKMFLVWIPLCYVVAMCRKLSCYRVFLCCKAYVTHLDPYFQINWNSVVAQWHKDRFYAAAVEILPHEVFGLSRKPLRKLAALSDTDCLSLERAKCLRTRPPVYHFAYSNKECAFCDNMYIICFVCIIIFRLTHSSWPPRGSEQRCMWRSCDEGIFNNAFRFTHDFVKMSFSGLKSRRNDTFGQWEALRVSLGTHTVQ